MRWPNVGFHQRANASLLPVLLLCGSLLRFYYMWTNGEAQTNQQSSYLDVYGFSSPWLGPYRTQ